MTIALVQSRAQQFDGLTIMVPTFLSGCGAGSLMVVFTSIRDDAKTMTPPGGGGWTQVLPTGVENNAGATPNSGRTQMFYKVAAGGETGLGNWVESGAQSKASTILEFSGSGTSPVDPKFADSQPASAGHITLPAITPTAGHEVVVVAGFSVATNATGFTPDSGWTEVSDQNMGSGFGPNQTVVYKLVPSASGSYTPGTNDGGEPWCAIGCAFSGGVAVFEDSQILFIG